MNQIDNVINFKYYVVYTSTIYSSLASFSSLNSIVSLWLFTLCSSIKIHPTSEFITVKLNAID